MAHDISPATTSAAFLGSRCRIHAAPADASTARASATMTMKRAGHTKCAEPGHTSQSSARYGPGANGPSVSHAAMAHTTT